MGELLFVSSSSLSKWFNFFLRIQAWLRHDNGMRAVTSQFVRYLSAVSSHLTDGELLAGFLNHNSEADFAQLVRRHGPMIWGACRRALPDHAEAEDAFQTVFLVLVQRGMRLVEYNSLGPWLHRVAVWTTRNVRRRNARRLAKRENLSDQIAASSVNADLSLDLDTALMALPEKFRSSIVLCHLLGFSRADAAAQLGCAERTLSSWLASGLAQLRQKLRGLDPVKALTVAAVAVPIGLSESAVSAAISWQTAAMTASVLSPTISQLVEGVIRMFWVKKATAVSVALFTMFAFGVGIGVSTHQLSTAEGGEQTFGVSQTVAVAAEVANDEDLDAKIAELKKKLGQLQELKAQKGVEKPGAQAEKTLPKSTPAAKPLAPAHQDLAPAHQDLEKKLAELQDRLRKLHADAELLQIENAARMQALKAETEVLSATIAALKKQKEMNPVVPPLRGKTTGAYLRLIIGTKDAMWPYQVNEIGVDGKAIGSIAFENAEIFGRYLTRTMKDGSGPKELRIVSRADIPEQLMLAAMEASKAAGFKLVLVAKEGANNTTDAAAQAFKDAVESYRKALEIGDKNKYTPDKREQDRALKELDEHLKSKLWKLKELEDQLKPPGSPVGQEQQMLKKQLDELMDMKEKIKSKIKDAEKLSPSLKPPVPDKPR